MITEQITIDDLVAGNLVPVATPTQGATPAPVPAAAPAAPAAPATKAAPPKQLSSSSVPNENELFKRLHATSFDPNSSIDRGKMEQLRAAVKKVGTGNFGKLAAAAYSQKPSDSTPKPPTVKFGDKNQETYIQVANGKFIPATQNDVKAGNQIWVKNPNKGQGETNKPNYVQVRTEKGGNLRPKSQLPGMLGSASNFLGDLGRTLDKTSRGSK